MKFCYSILNVGKYFLIYAHTPTLDFSSLFIFYSFRMYTGYFYIYFETLFTLQPIYHKKVFFQGGRKKKKKESLQTPWASFPSLSISIQIATTRQMFRRTIAYRALTHFLYYLWALPAVEFFFFYSLRSNLAPLDRLWNSPENGHPPPPLNKNFLCGSSRYLIYILRWEGFLRLEDDWRHIRFQKTAYNRICIWWHD